MRLRNKTKAGGGGSRAGIPPHRFAQPVLGLAKGKTRGLTTSPRGERRRSGAVCTLFSPPGRRWPEGPDEGAFWPYAIALGAGGGGGIGQLGLRFVES